MIIRREQKILHVLCLDCAYSQLLWTQLNEGSPSSRENCFTTEFKLLRNVMHISTVT